MTSQHTNLEDNDARPSSEVGDVFPDFTISLEEADRRTKMLQVFVREQMVEGEDYGIIPGSGSKPTLFKPGAEKLNAIFGLAPELNITNRVEDWNGGFVAYEVKVTLVNKRTHVTEAEGIGSCNSRERRYKNQDAANVANTILKMSKKRALIDATLSATRASGLFTQDLEDLEVERDGAARGAGSESAGRASGGYGYGNVLTDAQRGAILSMASKVFGGAATDEIVKIAKKPVEQLSKSEASGVIDRLRSMLVEQQLPRDGRGALRTAQESERNGAPER